MEQVIGARLELVGPESKAGRGVGLRIEVDQEHACSRLGDARGHVDRGRGLSDAAFLVRKRVDAGAHTGNDGTGTSGRARAIPGRRGNRSGVASCLRRTTRRRRASTLCEASTEPPTSPAVRASASASTSAPVHRMAAPPTATKGSTSSTATGGGARARASASREAVTALAPGVVLRPGVDDRARRLERSGRPLQEPALRPRGLEQRHRKAERDRDRDAGAAASRPDVDGLGRPQLANERRRLQRVLHQHVPGRGRISHGRHRHGLRGHEVAVGPQPRVGVFHVLHLGRRVVLGRQHDDVPVRLRPLAGRLHPVFLGARSICSCGSMPRKALASTSASTARRTRRWRSNCSASRTMTRHDGASAGQIVTLHTWTPSRSNFGKRSAFV